MSLKETIQRDLKDCLKEQKEENLSVLRLLWDSINKKEKQIQEELSDEEVQQIITSTVKKNREAIEQFKKGGREDLAEKEEREIEILKKYLPEQLTEQEVITIIDETIKEIQPTSISDIGKVMAGLMPKVKGKADGGLINKIVRERLSEL